MHGFLELIRVFCDFVVGKKGYSPKTSARLVLNLSQTRQDLIPYALLLLNTQFHTMIRETR